MNVEDALNQHFRDDLKNFGSIDTQLSSLTDNIGYNHKETVDMIGMLDRKSDDKHKTNTDKLEKIEQQTTMTNGRVRKLEKWQAGLIMAGSATVVLTGIIIGLIVYIYQYQLQVQTERINILLNK